MGERLEAENALAAADLAARCAHVGRLGDVLGLCDLPMSLSAGIRHGFLFVV